MSLIAGGLTVEKAKEIEILEISRLKAAGLDLTNGTSGGDGVTGLAPEIRDKISKVWVGRKHTPEARSKMSASKMGQVQSRETVEKRTAKNRGQKRPPEFSVKMSAIASGRPGRKHTDESRAKMSATRTGLKRLPYSHAAIENFSRSRRMLAPKSGFKGVGKKMKKGKWEACIEAGGKYAYLGRFESAESAARAYDRAAIETWGAGNCYLNFPVLKESQ